MDEERVDPALEPDDFEAPAVQGAFLDFAAREISGGLAVQHAAVFHAEPLFSCRIETNEVIGLAVDGNFIAIAGCKAAFRFRFVIAGEQAFRTGGSATFRAVKFFLEKLPRRFCLCGAFANRKPVRTFPAIANLAFKGVALCHYLRAGSLKGREGCRMVIIGPAFNLGKGHGCENGFGFSGHGKGNGEKAGKTQASYHAWVSVATTRQFGSFCATSLSKVQISVMSRTSLGLPSMRAPALSWVAEIIWLANLTRCWRAFRQATPT